MHRIVLVFIAGLAATGSAHAQTQQPQTAQQEAQFPDAPSDAGIGKVGYVQGHFGVAATTDTNGGIADGEGGFWLNSHLSVFGGYGLYRNVQTSASQPYVNIAIAQLAQRNIGVTGEARTPARYALGGLRFESEMKKWRLTPYAQAGFGYVWASASARFSYNAGSATVSGSRANGGEDATNDILSSGVFVGDDWHAAMFRVGGGASRLVWRSAFVDVGFSVSRIMAPTAITDSGVKVGLGYRF